VKFGEPSNHFKVNEMDYVDAHSDPECKGKWGPHFNLNGVCDWSALGPFRLPCLPYIACSKCKSAFLVPGFREWIEFKIATQFIFSKGLLSKKQIKFLRQSFDLSQERLAKSIGITDKHQMSKIESPKFENINMGEDKQIRMKIFFAKLIKTKDTDAVLDIISIGDSKVKLDTSKFPSKDDLENTIKIA